MLTSTQIQTICQLHYCITMDLLFELSPSSKFNMEAPASKDAVFPIQMLQAYIQDFFSNQGVLSEAVEIFKSVFENNNSNQVYLRFHFLENTAKDCIKQLLVPYQNNASDIEKFILGYSSYMEHNRLYKQIGELLKKKDTLLAIKWNMF